MITSGTRKQRGWHTVLAAVALATAVVGFGASSASARDEGGYRGDHGREWHGDRGHEYRGDWRRQEWERTHHPRGFYDYGYYTPPRVVYAPPIYGPPAYYPPSYYPDPSINFGFNFR